MWGLDTQMFRDTYTDSGACRNPQTDVNAHHIISQKLTLPTRREPTGGRPLERLKPRIISRQWK